MTNDNIDPRKPLRTWPLAAIAALFLAAVILVPVFMPDQSLSLVVMLGGVVSALLIVLWWLLLSRARSGRRVGVLLLIAIGSCSRSARWIRRLPVARKGCSATSSGSGSSRWRWPCGLPLRRA